MKITCRFFVSALHISSSPQNIEYMKNKIEREKEISSISSVAGKEHQFHLRLFIHYTNICSVTNVFAVLFVYSFVYFTPFCCTPLTPFSINPSKEKKKKKNKANMQVLVLFWWFLYENNPKKNLNADSIYSTSCPSLWKKTNNSNPISSRNHRHDDNDGGGGLSVWYQSIRVRRRAFIPNVDIKENEKAPKKKSVLHDGEGGVIFLGFAFLAVSPLLCRVFPF